MKYLILSYLILITLKIHSQSNDSICINNRVEKILDYSKKSTTNELYNVKDSLEFAIEVSKKYPYIHARVLSEYFQFVINKIGDIDLSIGILEDLNLLVKSTNNPRISSLYHFNKGTLYSYESNNRKKAMEEYNNALRVLEKNNILPDYNLLNNCGVAELSSDRYKHALELFIKSEKEYLKHPNVNDQDFLTTVNMNKGVAYIHLEKKDSAEYFFIEAVRNSELTQIKEDDFDALLFLGIFYQEEGFDEKAIDILEKAKNEIDKISGKYNYKALLFEGLSETYYKTGNSNKAFELKKSELKYRDSIFQSGVFEKVFALDYISEIKSLKQEKRINSLNIKLKEQSFLILTLVLVAILIAVIAISVLINYRLNKKRIINKIKAENERLEKESVRKEAEIKLLQNEEKLYNLLIELNMNKSEVASIMASLNKILINSKDPEFDVIGKKLKQLNSKKQRNENLKYINEVNSISESELFDKVRRINNSITDDEIKLIKLIRQNLSSNEISLIFNISNSSLMTKRYRLRKKLNIKKNKSLDDFINNL